MNRKQMRTLFMSLLLMTTARAGVWVDVYATVKDGDGGSLSGATAKLYGGSSPYGGEPYTSETMWWDTCYLSCYRSAGPVVLTIEKEGFGTWREHWDESEIGDYAFFEPICVLLPPCSVTGRVENASGDPVSNAVVRLDWVAGDGVVEHETITDAEGRYAMDGIGVGGYSMTVLPPPPYMATNAPVTLDAPETYAFPFTLAEGAAIRGTVTGWSSGTPLSNVTVQINGPMQAQAVSDTNGLYVADQLAEGEYAVTAAAAGYCDHSNTVATVSGQTVTNDIAMRRPATLRVRVDAPDGSALWGAPVGVWRVQEDASASWTAATDATGWSTVTGILPGERVLRVSDPYYQTFQLPIEFPDGGAVTQQVELARAIHFSGQVREAATAAHPIEGATVAVALAADTSVVCRVETTDAFGRFRMPGLAPGAYQVTATHPAYENGETNLTIQAGSDVALFLTPLPAPGYDLYVQVNCALAGIPIGQVAVMMAVWSEAVGGVLLEERRLVTDENGTLCFRGVPQGHAEFAVNHPDDTHRGWWKAFDTERRLVQNAKLVNIRLEPKKSAFTVDMNPPYAWMEGMPVYVQNFWVEIKGYDTAQGTSLYPARTGITDKDGKCFFERVACLPTRITIRRPGFALAHYDIAPDAGGSFATPVIVTRPAITAGTSFQLFFDQPVFNYLSGTTSIPIGQRGLPNSNTEGFDDTWSLDRTASLPFRATTAYGPRSPWGAGTYELFCLPLDVYSAFGEHSVPPRQIFRFAFRFPPQQVFIREGATTEHTIRAEVVPAEYHGTLFAADTLSAAGEPLYRPVTNTEVRFVIHETAQAAFTPSNLTHVVTTDASGNYAVTLPPGIYGIEIPSMNGYWGEKVVLARTGVPVTEYPWPAAYSKPAEWTVAAYDSAHLKGYGLRIDSADAGHLDLVTRLQRYHIRKALGESGEIARRLVFRNAQTEAWVQTSDLLESQSEMVLSGAGSLHAPVLLDDAGMFAVWTNLAAGAYTFEGGTHDYLQTQSTGQVFTCFDWGDYPGDKPAAEPPYGADPLPMRIYDGGESSFADPGSEAATVTVLFMDGEELSSYQTAPLYVRYTEWPTRVFGYASRVNDARVECLYISHGGDLYQANRNELGNWVASTLGAKANVNLSPYTLTVTARQADAQDFAVPDMPFRFNGTDYTAPHQFSGVTGEAVLAAVPGAAGAWAWERVGYAVNVTNTVTEVLATIYAAPVIDLTGMLTHARTGEPVSNAVVRLLRSDGGMTRLASGGTAQGVHTLSDGTFSLTGIAAGFGAYLLDVHHAGYLPVRTRLVLGDLITATNALSFSAALAQPLPITPVGLSLALDAWDRQGAVLHGVKAGGTEKKDETEEAVTLRVGASAAITTQTYPMQRFDQSDGSPGGTEDVALDDWLGEFWIVDARRTDANTNAVPLLPATDTEFYPKNRNHLPMADDPAGIEVWMRETIRNKGFYRRFAFPGRTDAAVITGALNVAEIPAGDVNPVLVALTGKGAATILPLGTNRLHSVTMPRWLAFAADMLATAGSVQGSYAELKETFASKQPDGKLSALPSITGGVSQENGYLSYTYGLGVAWTEGNEAAGEGGLSLGPGLLGLQFEASAAIGFSGETRDISFEVGGSVGKEEIDFSDYMPGIAKGIGVEGTVNSISGMAQTKHSGQFAGGDWREREVETSVGASFDLTLRYNLEGITGKLPYVGPFLTAADRTNLLKLYARLDAGGAVESKETWRTVELERAPVGDPNTGGYDSGDYVILYPELDPLTPSRHAFGGATSTDASVTNTFTLGLTFGTSFEGSALGDHLYVRAGLEITGNENDLVAGKPSLVITPNTVGDWPPVKRIEGDVNAFATAKLDVYVTEIEKTWSLNLARIDYQYTTESLMTMTDLDILVNEAAPSSTTFTGTLPVLAHALPRGSSYAVGGPWLAFGMYDAATRQTALVISVLADGVYGTPMVIATVEGLGLVRLAELGDGRWLLVWEEQPGLATNPSAFSVIRATFFEDGAWGTPQTVVALDGYLKEAEVFATGDTLSIAYVESHESRESDEGRIRAVVFDPLEAVWSLPQNIRASQPALGAALACVGASAGEVWSGEPGRILYIQSNQSVSSRYWDGGRFCVPGMSDYVYITAGPVDHVALCPAGTNDCLYMGLAESDGEIRIRRYAPDPARDPENPDYNWNGRSVAAMWPELGVAATGQDTLDDLACGWLGESGRLLTAWSRNGRLACVFCDPESVANGSQHALSSNEGGQYADIRIEPLSNATARVFARYLSPTVHELRAFTVSAEEGMIGPDPDATGLFTLIYLAGTGGSIQGVITQLVSSGESGTQVIAVPANDSGAFGRWSDGVMNAGRTDANVRSNLTVTARFRSVGGADLDWYAARGLAPEGGEDWSDVDARAVPGKGTTLLHENIADTDPADTNDVFRVLTLDPGPPVTVSFTPASAARFYTLQAATNLVTGPWADVPGQGPRPGAGGQDTMSEASGDPARFYRVKVEVP
ncbi:MAG: carboxypeptidase regulatory-like domain-containing protein [Kiritimatiellia bacterium]|jgi:hypothetical protein|nr:carboxypeptidase regulatory-like domain-containing protein [Kiritimatiellia bacterium]